MSNIPTAEEIIKKHTVTNPKENWERNGKFEITNYKAAMIEFAKLHLDEQATAICKKVKIIDDLNSYCGNTGSEYPPDQIVSEKSILNAYPKSNVK